MEKLKMKEAIKKAILSESSNFYTNPMYLKDIEESLEEAKESLRNGVELKPDQFKHIIWKRLRKYSGPNQYRIQIIENAGIELFIEVKNEYQERL